MEIIKKWDETFPSKFVIGDKISGHVCNSCTKFADKAEVTSENKRVTTFCMICGHRGEGIKRIAKVTDWFRIVPND